MRYYEVWEGDLYLGIYDQYDAQFLAEGNPWIVLYDISR